MKRICEEMWNVATTYGRFVDVEGEWVVIYRGRKFCWLVGEGPWEIIMEEK